MRPPAKACASPGFHRLMAEQRARLARMRQVIETVGLGQRFDLLHRRRARGHQRGFASMRRSTWAQILREDLIRRRSAVDDHAAMRLGLGNGQIALAQTLVELHVALLEGVGRLA